MRSGLRPLYCACSVDVHFSVFSKTLKMRVMLGWKRSSNFDPQTKRFLLRMPADDCAKFHQSPFTTFWIACQIDRTKNIVSFVGAETKERKLVSSCSLSSARVVGIPRRRSGLTDVGRENLAAVVPQSSATTAFHGGRWSGDAPRCTVSRTVLITAAILVTQPLYLVKYVSEKNVDLCSAYCLKTSNALVTLQEAKQNCPEKLCKTVKAARQISELVSSRPSDQWSKMPDGRRCFATNTNSSSTVTTAIYWFREHSACIRLEWNFKLMNACFIPVQQTSYGKNTGSEICYDMDMNVMYRSSGCEELLLL